jgi:hypothetical protein
MLTETTQSLHKAIYLTGGVNNALFTGKKRVTLRANIGADKLTG